VQRTSNFFNAKVIAVSTPTEEGASAIARLYEDTDRREFHVPCPRCGAYQVLMWKGIIYKREDGTRDLDDVHYRCEHCSGRIEERERPWMLERGEWRPGPRVSEDDAPPADTRGYHISRIYSPWTRWRALAELWITATTARDQRAMQSFVNLSLGEVWLSETEKITVEVLEKNREEYAAEIPDGVLMLSCGVDTQDDRLELEVVGWGAGRESWGLEYAVIPGDTSLDATWHKLDTSLQKTWQRADGRTLPIWCSFIDSGGHRTTEVYSFAKARQARNVYATKGYAGQGRALVGKPTTSNQLRVLLYPIGADTGKEAVYSRLALTTPGPGYCHWPLKQGFDDHYFKGLVSERRVRKKRGGRTVVAWEQRGRNEPLDCRVLATAAMESMNLDFVALAEKEAKDSGSGGGGAAPATTTAPRRRVYSKGVQW
jgi:phage terminase large subunit GpA-like protein